MEAGQKAPRPPGVDSVTDSARIKQHQAREDDADRNDKGRQRSQADNRQAQCDDDCKPA